MFEFTKIKKQKSPDPVDSSPAGLEFTVMPNLPEKGARAKRAPLATAEPEVLGVSGVQGHGIPKKLILLIIGILLAAGAAGAAYYWFALRSSPEMRPEIDIDVPISSGATRESTQSDADQDGLSDSREREVGTSPTSPDTDNDGLADGDEINIYTSDPLLSDTDADKFADGSEVAKGYSPTINSPNKATPEELALWEQKIAEFGLHEPTKTTLRLTTASTTASKGATIYQNKLYNYEISVSDLLAAREADRGSKVGFYVTGTVPEDQDVANDPMNIASAFKGDDTSLKEFVASLYSQSDLSAIDEIIVNGITAVKATTSADRCVEQHVFYSKDNRVIVFTLSCHSSSEFESLFNQMYLSFKFN